MNKVNERYRRGEQELRAEIVRLGKEARRVLQTEVSERLLMLQMVRHLHALIEPDQIAPDEIVRQVYQLRSVYQFQRGLLGLELEAQQIMRRAIEAQQEHLRSTIDPEGDLEDDYLREDSEEVVEMALRNTDDWSDDQDELP